MNIDPAALEIVNKLNDAGFIAYLAGGCVRDHLLGLSFADIDIATSASCDEVCSLFPRCIQVGASFGVVQVMMDGKGYEVATFRAESGYSDGRHPDRVYQANPEADARRRDFTINGMFYDPLTCQVIDYVQGAGDLKSGVIRAIGNPLERMEEDRLRALRAVRFACRLGFDIESETAKAVQAAAKKIPSSISVERIVDELTKMSSHPSFPKALVLLYELGILTEIFPEINRDVVRIAERIKQLGVNFPFELKLVGFFMHLPPPERAAVFDRLKLPCSAHQRLDVFHAHEALDFETAPPHLSARTLSLSESEMCSEALSVHMGEAGSGIRRVIEARRSELDFHIDTLRKRAPLLRANDLLARGIAAGPLMGKLLKEANNYAIDHDIRDKKQLLVALEKKGLWPS